LGQTYPDFELWVIENGSNDRTAEIARSFSDSRVKVFELGPVGVHGALQFGIENTRSKWLARMDADDLMFPDRLMIQMEFLRGAPNAAFVGTAYALLSPFGHIFEPVLTSNTREVTKDLLALNKRFFADPSIVFSRQAALEAGGADMEFTKGGDGVALLFRLLTKGKGWELAKQLHLYRVQPNSRSRRKDHWHQARGIRLKYAPEYAVHYRSRQNAIIAGGWYTVAVMELLAGEGEAVRQTTKFLRAEFPGVAARLRLLSYLGSLGRFLYKRRNPQKRAFRRRRDWERLFELFLDGKVAMPSTGKLETLAILDCS
jgi:glycosyltransferase involved in cell wall biosynthesis